MSVDLVEAAIDAVLTERLQSPILRMLVGMAGKIRKGYERDKPELISVLQRLSLSTWKGFRAKEIPTSKFVHALAPAWDKVTDADIAKVDPHEAAKPKNRKKLIFWVNHTAGKRIIPPARQREREWEYDVPGNTLLCITCFGDAVWENPHMYSLYVGAPHFFERISAWADTAYMIDPDLFLQYRRAEPASSLGPAKPERPSGRLSTEPVFRAREKAREGALALMNPEDVAANNKERYKKLLADQLTPEGVKEYVSRLIHLAHRRYVETFEELEQAEVGSVDYRIRERGEKLLRFQSDIWNLYKDIREKAVRKRDFEREHPEKVDTFWSGFHSFADEWAQLKKIKKLLQGSDEELYRN